MKNSIGNLLVARGIVIFLFILSITIAGQICINLLKETSNNVITEYVELDVIQKYINQLNQLSIHIDNFVLSGEEKSKTEIDKALDKCYKQLESVNNTLTIRHDHSVLKKFKNELNRISNLKNNVFNEENIHNRLILRSLILSIIENSKQSANKLLDETKVEIDNFIVINNTAVKHSTITIVSLGIFLLLIVTIGGYFFIKKLTNPISQLLEVTKKIGEGNFESKIKINSTIEYEALANSFNEMTSALQKTTVSRNYYNSILKNMIEPLIVTDKLGQIKTVNQITLDLLNYKLDELKDTSIEKLFDNSTDIFDWLKTTNDLKKQKTWKTQRTFLTKNGEKIPVFVSTSLMSNNKGYDLRYIFVAHNLSEKMEIEKKLEDERKEKQIAINDAHEEEKFRMAVDLHDGLGQILTAISYSIQHYFKDLKTNAPDYDKNIKTLQNQIDAAIAETKTIAHNLIPIALKDFGLLVATKNLINQANEKYDTNFSFEAYNYNTRIDQKLEKAIFRIFQEAINNIAKHSKATQANFQINKFDDSIVITMEDDGVGFNLNEKKSSKGENGIGLIGMQERINAFNGNFTINTQPNEGTEIIIEIPCNSN